jgi:hypothetical protein
MSVYFDSLICWLFSGSISITGHIVRELRWLMKDQFQVIWKEAVVANLKAIPRNSPYGTEKKLVHLSIISVLAQTLTGNLWRLSKTPYSLVIAFILIGIKFYFDFSCSVFLFFRYFGKPDCASVLIHSNPYCLLSRGVICVPS